MEITTAPIIGAIKKIPILFNKVELSFDAITSFNEIIYILKNNGNKNIENFIMKEYKLKTELNYPIEIFNDFEKKYFNSVTSEDFGKDKLFVIDFPKKFNNEKLSLIRDLPRCKTPSDAIRLYCNFIESNLSLLLIMASSYVDSYNKFLQKIEDIENNNNIMESQSFLDIEKLNPTAIKKEEERLKKIIVIYLINIIEFTNFVHILSKKISINHNLETLKSVFNRSSQKSLLKSLIISSDPNFMKDELNFIKNILDKSKNELNVKPNNFLFFDKSKININENIIIKKPIKESMIFSIKFKKSSDDDDDDVIIKDNSKKIEIKYQEFSIVKIWTILVNSEYRNGTRQNKVSIKRIKWNKIEVTKLIEVPEITENYSNLYDKFYK